MRRCVEEKDPADVAKDGEGRTRAVTGTDGEVTKNAPGSTWKARGQTEERKGR